MSLNLEENRTILIAKIGKIIDEKLPSAEAKLVKDFLDQYYLGVSLEDLRSKNIIDLYGALMSQWHFLYQRMPGESKIRIYNPDQETNGWQSPHSVIEIIHENKPFLLDTLRVALNKLDLNIHLIIHAEGIRFSRDKNGKIKAIIPINYQNGYVAEAPIYIEIDRQSDNAVLDKIKEYLERVLLDVDNMVRDWKPMLQKLDEAIEIVSAYDKNKDKEEIVLFLRWLAEDHFTFIGYAEYDIKYSKDGDSLNYIHNSGLGVLANNRIHNTSLKLDNMYPIAKQMILNKEVVLIGKTDTISTVHRPVYTDFIAIKLFDAEGNVIKALRFIGLYTSTGYNEQTENIPFIREKIARVFKMSGFARASHDGKELLHIIESLPRDEVFHAREEELFNLAIGILHLQERQRIRLFIRRDVYGKYYSCLVFVPREIFNSELRGKMQEILLEELRGTIVTFDTRFSESLLARIHFMVRTESIKELNYDVEDIEQQLIDAARTWNDDLRDALNDEYGEERANELFKVYDESFPASYREFFYAQAAVVDIEHMEHLRQQSEDYLEMSLYRPLEDPEYSFRFKLFRKDKTIPLSDVVPILEKMGLRIISERPHEIKLRANKTIWINDYRMEHPKGDRLSPEIIKEVFQEAFSAIWRGEAENDEFNRLVLSSQMRYTDVALLRTIYRYLWQTGFAFSQKYVEDAMDNNHNLAKKLIDYFYAKFDTEYKTNDRKAKLEAIKKEIENDLDSVSILNEDRIIRHYLGTLEAMVRTNFFQVDKNGKRKNFTSYKFDSQKVPDLPLPKPICEIFVYTPQVEGIHLRGDRVARGGIRWSDRHEDYRTEVLGLMKAQQVKNAVIVPLGAKGGFVMRKEANAAEVKKCYQTFMRGLLDLTDNYKGSEIINPENTICYDDKDPYLVVAADKGTASFSDLANSVSAEYNFWLGDAFASGGSAGYDHKKLAITARGAWESVKLHFNYLNIDVQLQSISVIGIGDMAGDVFGNGMLRSDKIRLLAAFNHMHIFIDPNPDAAVSFKERQRLFDLPNSKWDDYNPKLISPGGGVFARSAKKIPLSKEVQLMLDTDKESMMPNELIQAILKMRVDLLFNGGIGTFVKATSERNNEVGDRSNDAIRINANQLRCKVVCEGGNLGFTQLARIEYAKLGGIINTDAIDNSGGVNCSDNEVNIKILLGEAVEADNMTSKQRNELLASMSEQVCDLVLANNIKQNQAITVTVSQAAANIQMHDRLLKQLEKDAGLDPVVEFLPNSDELAQRIANKTGFTRPEIAILMAYTKIFLKKQILSSDLASDPFMVQFLINYFPEQLRNEEFKKYMHSHRLRDAIVATQISNFIVDEMGINFIQRLEEESGSDIPDIVRAYILVRELFNVPNFRERVWALGSDVTADTKLSILQNVNRLIRRCTRWVLNSNMQKQDIQNNINLIKPLILELEDNIDGFLKGAWLDIHEAEYQRLIAANVPTDLASCSSKIYSLFSSLELVAAAIEYNLNVLDLAKMYFEVGSGLRLGWFGELINKQPVSNNWQALARAAFRDDVDHQQCNITVSILRRKISFQDWLAENTDAVRNWRNMTAELETSSTEFTMFAIALKELLKLSDL